MGDKREFNGTADDGSVSVWRYSSAFCLPIVLATAYLNMGQSSCGGGNTLKCQGIPVTHVFDAQDGSTQTAGPGDDVILVLAGPATINAGAGDDLVCVVAPQDGIRVNGGFGDDEIYGGPGNDFLSGDYGQDALRGGEGDDVLDAGNLGHDFDWLDGGPGDDILYGDAGPDVLIGGDGSDELFSGDEDGILNGGPGFDYAYLCSTTTTEEVEWSVSMYANPRCTRIARVRLSPATLHADELQEGPGPGKSDRPYFGFLKFSAQFGVEGSTLVEFIDRPVFLDPITNSDPETVFPESIQQEMEFGLRFIPSDPESSSEAVWVDGVLMVAMESDDTGWSPVGADGVRDKLIDRAGCLQTTLENNVETMTQWSVLNFLGALSAVRGDLASACGAVSIGGGASLGDLIMRGLEKLVRLFANPDDPMGTAFIVRLGVSDDYFNDHLAPTLGTTQTQICDDGSEETFVAGCEPFLANPCQMKLESDAISQYASFCSAAPILTVDGVRSPGTLEVPFEYAGQGKWTVRLDL